MDSDSNAAYFAVIPANVRYSQLLEPTAKLLYAELTAHANEFGVCHISNTTLAAIFDVEVRTIQRLLSNLKENKFIFSDLSKGGFQTNREIRLQKEEA
jgi:hypothetical protein